MEVAGQSVYDTTSAGSTRTDKTRLSTTVTTDDLDVVSRKTASSISGVRFFRYIASTNHTMTALGSDGVLHSSL